MQIWKLKDLKNLQEIIDYHFPVIAADQYPKYKTSASAIAIIGGGPKGLYALEAAVHSIKKVGIDFPVEIHWFNNSNRFATGDNYRIDQPEYLLINFPIGKINMWNLNNGSESFIEGPVDMVDWLKKSTNPDLEVEEGDFASRALVGAYLKAGAISILKDLPANLKVKCIEAKVEDIIPAEDHGKYIVKGAGINTNSFLKYERMLLATGHSYVFHDELTTELNLFSKQSGSATYVGNVYPVDQKLKEIKSTDKVCIKGLGLTFIDTVLALSEGRGGVFSGDEKISLQYTASGNEPLAVYAYSNSGVPMLPRVSLPTGKEPRLSYISSDWVKVLVNLKGRGNIDFESDVLPVLEKEYQLIYHEKFFQDDKQMHMQLEPIFKEKNWHADDDLSGNFPQGPKFSLNDLLEPFKDIGEVNETAYHTNVVQYLKNAVSEATSIPESSPLMAMSGVWRSALPFISSMYAFGGFTGASQEKFEKEYLGKFNRISFGPPLINVQKLLALAEAGQLFFRLGKDTEVIPNASTGKYRVYSQQTNYCKEVSFLLDARIAKPNLGQGCPELYQNLIKRGLASSFKNGDYTPGCIAIENNGNIINKKGEAVSGITLYGTPTEGVTLDNDSLSRERNDFASGWAARWANMLKSKNQETKAGAHG